MNYLYDVLLNFNSVLYEIYEWNKTDEITHIRKIPLFKISNKDLFNIINNKVKIGNEFLSKIYKKTEYFNKNKIGNIDYSFLLTDGKEVIALKQNKNSYFEYSKLLYEEELDALEYSESVKTTKLEYEIISKNKINIFQTRNENTIKKYILNTINEIINDNDLDKLKYIYLECFNKKINGNIKNQIYIDLKENWDNVYLNLYNFLRKISLKH